EEMPALAGAPVLSVAILIMFGLSYQWLALIVGRNSQGVVILLFGSFFIPLVAGIFRELPWLTQLSPYHHYSTWYPKPEDLQPLLPLVVFLMLFVGIIAWLSYRSRLSRLEQAVDRKLEKMGVLQQAGEGGTSVPRCDVAGDAAPGD